MGGVLVEGEPVLSGGRGQDEWLEAIRHGVRTPVQRPSLTFVVSTDGKSALGSKPQRQGHQHGWNQ